MRELSTYEEFSRIVTMDAQRTFFIAQRTSTLPTYECDAAGVEQVTYRIRYPLGNFRLV